MRVPSGDHAGAKTPASAGIGEILPVFTVSSDRYESASVRANAGKAMPERETDCTA